MATQQRLDFFGILSEIRKITNSNSRHFLTLSLLFLLPISFSLLIFPEILPRLRYNQNQITSFNPLFFYLIYASTLLTFYLCAIATISDSFYHGFFNRPVKLICAFKSLSNSLLPLFVTFFCGLVVILVCFFSVGLGVFGLISAIKYIGFEIEYSSVYFRVFYGGVLGSGLFCVYVNWILAPVIVVVESSWGFEPLRRSAYLVKGMRGSVVWMLLYFALMVWFYIWGSWGLSLTPAWVLRDLQIVVVIVGGSLMLMWYFLLSITVTTMLYLNCKALCGELVGEIVKEFDGEYVSLPVG